MADKTPRSFTERLAGANVLVTGGSTATGPFICRAFADLGANVALTYFTEPQGAEETAAYVREKGRVSKTYRLDIVDQSSIDGFIRLLMRDWKRLDVVVLCAGTFGLRNFASLTREQVDSAIDGNLKGNFMLAKDLGYWMKKTGGLGRIIQITAQSADNPTHSVFGLSKAAQRESIRFLAYHLAPEVTVNAIQPQRIDTNPEHPQGEDYPAPLERMVHSREIARLCALLTDSGFDTVTGDVIRMDGGRHITGPSRI